MAFQQWGQQSKKRGRDDDGDVAIGGTEGFTEHRNVGFPRSGDKHPLDSQPLLMHATETVAIASLPHISHIQKAVLRAQLQ